MNDARHSASISRILFLLATLLMASFLGACGGLAGEQEVVSTATPESAPSFTEEDAPEQLPDLHNGAVIFQRNCTECHGAAGDSQGVLVQDGSVPAMPSFLDAEHIRTQKPADYYTIITYGNIDALMPPWLNNLTQQERWDVAMYVHSLRSTSEQIARGQQIYADECASCHGDEGRGDGPEMIDTGRQAGDFTHVADTATLTDRNFFVSIDEGIGENMPAYGDTYSEDDIWAAVAYVRLLGLTNFEPSRDAAIRLAQAGETVTISGMIRMETEDAALPDSLDVNLRYGSQEAGIQAMIAPMQPDGSYSFTDVPAEAEQDYIVYVMYNDQFFISDVLPSNQLLLDNTIDLSLYETIDDPGVITVSQIDTTIARDQLDVGELTSGLVFNQRIRFKNSSDRQFALNAPTESGVQGIISLLIQLPPGSVLLSPLNDPRFLVVQEQYAMVYADPIPPGETDIALTYFIPYETEAVIDQPFQYPIDGEVNVYVAPENINVVSDVLLPSGTQNITGVDYRLFSGDVSADGGASLAYTLQGSLVSQVTPTVVSSDSVLPVILIIALVLVLIIGVFIWRSRRGPSAEVEIQQLIRQIAELDAMHDQGQINHDLYRRQRADLKARLATLMSESQET
ncbi:MAG: c-type cytochrome [Anaerolineae bacterium]|nr:c-type cytochrome [Anaerolineae bacterium]